MGVTRTPSQQGGGAGGGPLRSTGVSGFTAASYYSAPANSLPGHVDGFVISQVFRVIGPIDGASRGAGLACFWLFAGDGGYHLSLAPDGAGNIVRAVWGIGQDSDGQVIDNAFDGNLDYQPGGGAPASGPWWRLYGRLYVQTLAFDGAVATGYLNGEPLAVLTPNGGYRPPDAAFTPFLGRNENPGSPTPLVGVELVGAGYRANVVATEQEVVDHHLACLEAGTFADWPAGGFSSWWTFDGEASAPAVLADQGAGGVDFTRTGALALALAERVTYF